MSEITNNIEERRPRINFGELSEILGKSAASAKESAMIIFSVMGGLDKKVAADMDSVVRAKHTHFGILVAVIVLVQSFIAGSAWSDLMHSVSVGILVFFAWMLIFGALDSLMMNLTNRDMAKGNSVSISAIIGRIVIIGFTSYLNSLMAEIRIFDAEIKLDIYQYQQDNFQKFSDETDARIDSLKREKSDNQKKIDEKALVYTAWLNTENEKINQQASMIQQRRTDLVLEVEGSAGSKKRGDGAVADTKREAINQEEQVLSAQVAKLELEKTMRPEYIALQAVTKEQELANKKIDEQIAKEEAVFNKKKTEISKMRNDGFLDRYNALGRIASGNWLVWVVFGFFFILEMMVLIVKFTMMGRDEYHDILLNHTNDVFKEKIMSAKEEHEKTLSAHELVMYGIIQDRIEIRKKAEIELQSTEAAYYPVEKARMEKQFNHAVDITKLIDESTQDQQVKSLFKFNWAMKFFRLFPAK